nr:2586_t:CDS:1 [Entrophospora candida]
MGLKKEDNNKAKQAIPVSDKTLFTVTLFSTFVKNNIVTSSDIRKATSLMAGNVAASTLGLTSLSIVPLILTSIIDALGFGTGRGAANSFASWFMSLYGGVFFILQSIGTTGLGGVGTLISNGFGAAVRALVGALGGAKLAYYFNIMELTGEEKQNFEKLVQIEEKKISNNDNTMVTFTLTPTLLYNKEMLKLFVEAFIACSSFANSNLFKFYFQESGLFLWKLKYHEKYLKGNVYNLLVSNYGEYRVKPILKCHLIVGYDLDLSDYEPPSFVMKALVAIWRNINKGDGDGKIKSKL